MALVDVLWTPKPERGYKKKRNDGTPKPERGYKNRNDGTKKKGTRAHFNDLPKPPFYKTALVTGPKFIHPHLPTLENTILGGGCIKGGGGRMKLLARGASKDTPPAPSPEKCLMARNGGGAYIIKPPFFPSRHPSYE